MGNLLDCFDGFFADWFSLMGALPIPWAECEEDQEPKNANRKLHLPPYVRWVIVYGVVAIMKNNLRTLGNESTEEIYFA